ncbi:hypothetical protein SNEBB_009611 [Seison nebaliae]|nr:hypothetical protein SNEBB_009611 [Seison nebaliae]
MSTKRSATTTLMVEPPPPKIVIFPKYVHGEYLTIASKQKHIIGDHLINPWLLIMPTNFAIHTCCREIVEGLLERVQRIIVGREVKRKIIQYTVQMFIPQVKSKIILENNDIVGSLVVSEFQTDDNPQRSLIDCSIRLTRYDGLGLHKRKLFSEIETDLPKSLEEDEKTSYSTEEKSSTVVSRTECKSKISSVHVEKKLSMKNERIGRNSAIRTQFKTYAYKPY